MVETTWVYHGIGLVAVPAAALGGDSFPIRRSSPSGALISNTNSKRPPCSNKLDTTE
jgi:hypothetical protein